jgi:hypothetical protein
LINPKDGNLITFYGSLHHSSKEKTKVKDFTSLVKNIVEDDDTTFVTFHSTVWDWKNGEEISQEKTLDGYHSVFFWNERIIGQRGIHKFQFIQMESNSELVTEEYEHNFDKFVKLTVCGDLLVGSLEEDDTVVVWNLDFKLIRKWHADAKIHECVGINENFVLLASFSKIHVMDIRTGKTKHVGGHINDISCFSLFGGDTLLSGDVKGNIKIWSVKKVIELFD